ncbi:hypothetical protein ACFSCV_04330 [Methylopila henanensis]|uniref:Phosphoribosyltransferase n=1 Tax=Methylopila henanensis TaxID=873516 RepID=A0ABW4K244_9HYPH
MTTLDRDETIDAILRLIPHRPGDRAGAVENLRTLDDRALSAELMTLRQAVDRLAPAAGTVGRGDPEARARAGAMIRSGLRKIEAVREQVEARHARSAGANEGSAAARERNVLPQVSIPSAASRDLSMDNSDLATVEGEGWPWSRPMAIELPVSPPLRRGGAARERVVIGEDVAHYAEIQRAMLTAAIDNVMGAPLLDVFGYKQGADAGDLVDLALRDEAVQEYFHTRLAPMSHELLRVIRRRFAQGSWVPDEQSAEIWRRAAAEVFEGLNVPSSMTDPVFMSDDPAFVSEATAFTGLAKLVSTIRRYRPDLIVIPDGAGAITGSLIAAECGVPSIMSADDLAAARGGPKIVRVAVVDDIVRSGRTMDETLELCRKVFGGGGRVVGAALVGSVDGVRMLGDQVFLPNISPDRNVRLPWDPFGEYRRTDSDHILGDGRPDRLTVGRDLLRRAADRMLAWGAAASP